MKRRTVAFLIVVVALVCAQKPQPPDIDIWTAAAQGNVKAIKQHVAADTDLTAREPAMGGTPLHVAVFAAQTEAAGLLIENGADLNLKNNFGSTPLHVAAFFGRPEAVKLLLEKGADATAKDLSGATPLDMVASEWNEELEQVYRQIAQALQTQLDLGRIKAVRPQIADLIRQHAEEKKREGPEALPEATKTDLKGAYSVNGELHVNIFGTPESKPVTSGHQDMKPSWSKMGGMLVFFRVTEFARDIPDWKTAICVVKVDGTGFRKLTDGSHTDFNPTWTRDGSNLVVLNRQNRKTGGYFVMFTKHDSGPGDEYTVSDTRHHTYAYSCLTDGRILVSSSHRPAGYFLMTPRRNNRATYEPLQCELARKGRLDRISVSPGERKVCFEFQEGFGPYRYPGRRLYVADFDAKARTIMNPVAIANKAADKDTLFLYPRWTKDEGAVVYHSKKGGTNQLYMYRVEDGSTIRVSTDPDANYMFPHGEETPK